MGYWESFWSGLWFQLRWVDSGINILYQGPPKWTFLPGYLLAMLFGLLVVVGSSIALYIILTSSKRDVNLYGKVGSLISFLFLILLSGHFLLEGVAAGRAYFHFASSKIGEKKSLKVEATGYKLRRTSGKHKKWVASFDAILKHNGESERVYLSDKNLDVVSKFRKLKYGDWLQVIENDKGQILYLFPEDPGPYSDSEKFEDKTRTNYQ